MPQRATVTWRGDQVTADVRGAAVRGVQKACEHWLTEARQEVPIEEATLERSGVATVDETDLTGAVSFDTPYAVRQHEDLSYRHDPGRKAKYLEDPGNREASTMLDLMAAEVRRETR